jgi:hypothetical protein
MIFSQLTNEMFSKYSQHKYKPKWVGLVHVNLEAL